MATGKARSWVRRGLTGAAAAATAVALIGVLPAGAAPAERTRITAEKVRAGGYTVVGGHALGYSGASTGGPVPAQMHQLDFLLGTFRCVSRTVIEGEPVSTVKLVYKTTRTIGGHEYVLELTQAAIPGVLGELHGRWDFGWDPVQNQFSTYYYDDYDGKGLTTSPGWVNGHFVVTGWYSVLGNYSPENIDDFTVVDSRHFVDHTSLVADGQHIDLAVVTCSRV